MAGPDVTCIIPTRNRAAMVGDAIDSALSQSHPSIEVVVVDDGSTDGTEVVLARFGPRIRVERTDAGNVAVARNIGLRAATAPYVALLDSDDIWQREKIATQLAAMRRTPDLGFTFTDCTVSEPVTNGQWAVVQTRQHDDPTTLRALLLRNFTCTSTLMIRTDAARAVGGFDESMARGTDYLFLLRVAARHPFARVPVVLADYRWHEDSLTGGSRRRNAENYIGVIEQLAATDPSLFALAQLDADALITAQRDRIAALPAGQSSYK